MSIEIKKSEKPVIYEDAKKMMEERLLNVDLNKSNELIWTLEHPDIYTAGTSYNQNDILDKSINILETNRGGKITYHGPGQLICYFVIDLKKRKKDIRNFVNSIETAAILFLNEFGIEAKTFKDRIGIWVTKNKGISLKKEEKIGAIGLRLKKWTTYHGLSFNINPDLNYFKKIYPCGLKEYSTTSMKALGVDITSNEFDKLFLEIYLKELKKL